MSQTKVAKSPPGSSLRDSSLHERLVKAAALVECPRTKHLEGGRPRFVNRLALEGSPYLLQHAFNPVDWFPWGEEAFALARERDVPVFLSVGYATCHWCHVMEEESFEDLEVAKLLNQSFVCVKVDREERPDVDDVYMSALHALRGRGGWPMTVVMTPEGSPFFAATYLPPRAGARGAGAGLVEVTQGIVNTYREERDLVRTSAQEITEHLVELATPRPSTEVPTMAVARRAAKALLQQHDDRYGGFGGTPKFPMPSYLRLVSKAYEAGVLPKGKSKLLHSLRAMAEGGIYDQLGGGFHRYATDRAWAIPHFEKMLYDNAQLVPFYLWASRVSEDAIFERVARETLDYVAREMRAPEGGFFSATDADSEGEEGRFFVWSPSSVREVLGVADAELLLTHYGVRERGNFEGENVLYVAKDLDELEALGFGSPEDLGMRILRAKASLYEARSRRPSPLCDDKVLTAWNGLMISAFAQAGRELEEPYYIEVASAAADFLLEHARLGQQLARSWRHGEVSGAGMLDDYAFLIAGLLDLFEATFSPRYFDEAIRLQRIQDEAFGAEQGGYYLTSKDAHALLYRAKPDYDGAEPSGNSIAAWNLWRLWRWTGEVSYQSALESSLASFGTTLKERGLAMSQSLALLFELHAPQAELVVVVPEGMEPAQWRQIMMERARPGQLHVMIGQEERLALGGRVPFLEGKEAQGAITAYYCEAGTCSTPITSLEEFGSVPLQ